MARITFWGAARTVTGSKHLIETDRTRVLVDCGMYQGRFELRKLNEDPFPFHPERLDAVILTHAHNDHLGLLPKLVKEGFTGPVYATPATIGLARIALPDSARIQEEDARHRVKHGHPNAKPLYTEEDAYAALKQLMPIGYGQWSKVGNDIEYRFRPAGHILGSAFAELSLPSGQTLLMSGDLGRRGTPIIRDPDVVESADFLVLESTYGDRLHSLEDPEAKLEEVLNRAWHGSEVVLVPSFAIGRTQELMFYMKKLQDRGAMPRIPVFIDSPMAVSVSNLYLRSKEEYDQDMLLDLQHAKSDLEPEGVVMVQDREQSKELNGRSGPMVIISGSGMANGGRIVHHLLRRLGNPSTTVLFTGYQAEGTLGRQISEGAKEVRIFGERVEVAAKVEQLSSLSAHADKGEILAWLEGFQSPPLTTFLVHGEPAAQESLAAAIREKTWDVSIPYLGDHFTL